MKRSDDLNQNDVLLQRLTQTVFENLENEQFGVEDLSEKLGMSRSNLHRKLKLLKGLSVSQFIRQIRLEEAMKLLQNNVATTAEIAYRVGFNSPSYFHKCFLEHYGFPPGEVKKGTIDEPLYTEPKAEVTLTGGEKQDKDKQIPEDLSEDFKAEPMSIRQSMRHRQIVITKIVLPLVFVLLAVLLGTYYFSPGPQYQKSIAVLPLDNFTGEPEQDYFVNGFHDALIGALGQLSALRVISRTSTMRYRQTKMPMQQIAKELGVDVIVEGSVYGSGDQVRIQLQLIEAFPDERHLWAKEYQQDLSEILVLQSNVVKNIANKIQITLSPREEERLTQTRSVNPETYKAYLRGMYYLDKSTEEDFQKGMQYLHQAIDNDPADPLAYAGLALGYITMGHSASNSSVAFIRAKAAALQAIKLDSTLIEAHAALGRIYLYYEWDWEAAERTFRYVNEVNPSMATNHYHYAWYLYLFGRREEALLEHELSRELDPLGPKNTAWMAWLYAAYGEYQNAEKELRKARDLDENYVVNFLAQGFIYEQQERHKEAVEVYEQMVTLYPDFSWVLGVTYQSAGQTDKTRAILAKMEQLPPSPWNAHGLAVLYSCLGEYDKAFQWLAYKPHHAWVPWLRVIPFFSTLSKDPRFHEVIAEMNLPPVSPPLADL